MAWERWGEFFEGDDTRMSMPRLLSFLSFWPATVVLVITKTDNALLYYLGAYVVGYVGGKGVDAWRRRPVTPINTAKPVEEG